MADELKLGKATYQGYDTGDRPTPADVLARAQEARVRVDAFMGGLGDRIIANLKGGICPNAATVIPGMSPVTRSREARP
jgi:hypothetical protein